MNKSSLSIMGSALIASVLLVTASSFAVDAPVAAPADANGVSPTFSGLTVNGDVNFNEELVIEDGVGVDEGIRVMDIGVSFKARGAGSFYNGAAFYPDAVDQNGVVVNATGVATTTGFPLDLNPGGDVTVGQGAGGDLIVNGDIEAAGGLNVAGNVSLPIEQAILNFSNERAGLKSHIAICPNGKRPVSCSMYFTAGHANAVGPGTLIFGNGCAGGYVQQNADRVSGIVTGMCL